MASITKADDKQNWQQTKSQLTRQAILQAAVDCFYEYGYANTSTAQIADKAQVSRGAMLHHFPSRAELVAATVGYLNHQRVQLFTAEENAAQAGAEFTRIDEGIDIYWRQLNTPTFIVFFELKTAARTDLELAAVLEPALAEYESAWLQTVIDLFPDLSKSNEFERATHLTQILLEGMAMARATHQNLPETLLLDWLKKELNSSFSDVQGSIKR